MPIEILMPALSPTMKEGNLARWLKKEGQIIKAGEVIAEIETDKATMEVEAVDEGVLGKIIVPQGTENVAVNSLIALILTQGEDASSLDNYNSQSNINANLASASEEKNNAPINATPIKEENSTKLSNQFDQSSQFNQVNQDYNLIKASPFKASPLAKKIAYNNNLNLNAIANQISGSGPRGRIIKDDIINWLNANNSKQQPSAYQGQYQGQITRNPQEYQEIKNNNIRKIIAKRLVESKQNIPHFYLSCDLNISKLLDLRATINQEAILHNQENPAYKISLNDFIIKACALALKKVPAANSAWSEEATLIYNNIDISVAVAIDNGLITPIVKNADQKSIIAISNEMKELAKKARQGKLQPEEFQGGSFSISNLGMYGIDNFAAIINPPQSCIIAIARAVEKPIVENGQIKIAQIITTTLSCDHRTVDGAVAAQLLKWLRHFIENPAIMLL
jgi:pyruvate dehydrogenase E2 component (dihydrolipoamide acetyltransferase)